MILVAAVILLLILCGAVFLAIAVNAIRTAETKGENPQSPGAVALIDSGNIAVSLRSATKQPAHAGISGP
jgi:hypothetical protein